MQCTIKTLVVDSSYSFFSLSNATNIQQKKQLPIGFLMKGNSNRGRFYSHELKLNRSSKSSEQSELDSERLREAQSPKARFPNPRLKTKTILNSDRNQSQTKKSLEEMSYAQLEQNKRIALARSKIEQREIPQIECNEIPQIEQSLIPQVVRSPTPAQFFQQKITSILKLRKNRGDPEDRGNSGNYASLNQMKKWAFSAQTGKLRFAQSNNCAKRNPKKLGRLFGENGRGPSKLSSALSPQEQSPKTSNARLSEAKNLRLPQKNKILDNWISMEACGSSTDSTSIARETRNSPIHSFQFFRRGGSRFARSKCFFKLNNSEMPKPINFLKQKMFRFSFVRSAKILRYCEPVRFVFEGHWVSRNAQNKKTKNGSLVASSLSNSNRTKKIVKIKKIQWVSEADCAQRNRLDRVPANAVSA